MDQWSYVCENCAQNGWTDFMKSNMKIMPLDVITLVYNILKSARTREAEAPLPSLMECGDSANHNVLTIVTSIKKVIFFHSMQWVHSTASSGCQGTKNMSGN
jgi:hypothetical protein